MARPGRSDDGLIGIEGRHLLEEALLSGLRVETVFLRTGDDTLLNGLALPAAIEVLELAPDLFASAVTTESPQGIAALLDPPVFRLADVLGRATPLVLVAAGLQDPGNLGTLVRSAEAFGATGIITLPGTASLWNPKALRASSGSAFRLPVVTASEGEAVAILRAAGVQTLAAVAAGNSSPALTGPAAIFIGNEGSGLSRTLIAQLDGSVTIPYPGPVESLNAAIAGSVLLYEACRQRRQFA